MTIDEILDMVMAELARAESIHPHWPGDDLVHAAGIVSEESGELIRAALRNRYAEGGTVADIRKEAVHTATTAIRLLKNLEEEKMERDEYGRRYIGEILSPLMRSQVEYQRTMKKAKCGCGCTVEDRKLEDVNDAERGSILEEALEIINGERQDVYGNPEDSFALIAEYWSTYLDHHIQATDVAVMMVFFKMARESHQHKRDNLVDAAGYLGILGDMYGKNGRDKA